MSINKLYEKSGEIPKMAEKFRIFDIIVIMNNFLRYLKRKKLSKSEKKTTLIFLEGAAPTPPGIRRCDSPGVKLAENWEASGENGVKSNQSGKFAEGETRG